MDVELCGLDEIRGSQCDLLMREKAVAYRLDQVVAVDLMMPLLVRCWRLWAVGKLELLISLFGHLQRVQGQERIMAYRHTLILCMPSI